MGVQDILKAWVDYDAPNSTRGGDFADFVLFLNMEKKTKPAESGYGLRPYGGMELC